VSTSSCKTVFLLHKQAAMYSNVKAYQCDICGKHFQESSMVKLHTDIHTGAMPYQCEFCSFRVCMYNINLYGVFAPHV